MQEKITPPPQNETSTTIDSLDYLIIIASRWRMIAKVTAGAFVLSIIVALILPKIYSSTAKVLPPQQDQGVMAMMMGQMGGGMANLASDLLGKGSPADLYVGILNSETASDAIIDRFKLMEVYDEIYRLDAYKTLANKVKINAGKKDGIISITVEDKNPKRAADIANAYVEELGKMTLRLNMSGANQKKTYIEEHLAKAKVELAKAEENLKNFQVRNKALDITEQAKGTIKGVADLTAQLAAEQVKLAALQNSLTDSSLEVQTQRAVIARLKGQIAQFEGSSKGGSVPTVGSVPTLGQEYIRLMREFKIQETLVDLLTKQFEIQKLSETMNVDRIQVIQKARVADKPSKPNKAVIVLASTLMTCSLAIIIVLLLDQVPAKERKRWCDILTYLKAGSEHTQ